MVVFLGLLSLRTVVTGFFVDCRLWAVPELVFCGSVVAAAARSVEAAAGFPVVAVAFGLVFDSPVDVEGRVRCAAEKFHIKQAKTVRKREYLIIYRSFVWIIRNTEYRSSVPQYKYTAN